MFGSNLKPGNLLDVAEAAASVARREIDGFCCKFFLEQLHDVGWLGHCRTENPLAIAVGGEVHLAAAGIGDDQLIANPTRERMQMP